MNSPHGLHFPISGHLRRGVENAAWLIPVVLAVVVVMASGALGSPGDTIWTKRYNGPADDYDYPQSIAVSPDGARVFVTGYSPGATSGRDYATVAYDSTTGHRQWVARYNGPGNGGDVGADLAVSLDGARVFVTGSSYGSGTGSDFATVAYDSTTGHRQWVARYDGPGGGDDYGIDLAVSPDGATVFVTGSSKGSTTGDDYATLAYDAATGHQRWTTRYTGAGNNSDLASSLAVSPDGSAVFVTGTSAGSTGSRYSTVAYDSVKGRRLWLSRYRGPTNSAGAFSLAVSPDGARVFVTGGSSGPGTGSDYATVAYEASSGDELWVTRYDGEANFFDEPHSLTVSPDGAVVFVTGTSWGLQDDYATVAYEAASGHELWVSRYNDPENGGIEEPTSIGISPDGTVVLVTGASCSSAPGGGCQFATVSYDASTGLEFWVARYTTGDGASSLVVSPDGTAVFVTGYGYGATSGLDYLTVAYQAGPAIRRP